MALSSQHAAIRIRAVSMKTSCRASGWSMHSQLVVVSVILPVFIVLMVMALTGIRQARGIAEEPDGRRDREGERMAPAPRARGLRPLRRDRQAGLLPAGATVTFAAE